MVNSFVSGGLALKYHPNYVKTTSVVRGNVCNDGTKLNLDIEITPFFANVVPSYAEVRATLEALMWAELIPSVKALGGGFERTTALAPFFS